MAVTSIWAVNHHLSRVIDYATNVEKTNSACDYSDIKDVIDYTTSSIKTEQQLFAKGINVFLDSALQEFITTKKNANKEDGVLAFHAYQSFAPGEVDAPTAHKIGIELANAMWGNEFEIVVTTHTDRNHLHNHFVVNSVSFLTHKRFCNTHADYRRFKALSDAICRKYELSVIDTYKSGKHYSEYHADLYNQPTKRSLIIKDVETAISNARTWKQFLQNLQELQYEIKFGKHIAIRTKGTQKYFRLYKLDKNNSYSEENIKNQILQNAMNIDTFKPSVSTWRTSANLKHMTKYTGFKALYIKYMFMLGIIPKNRSNNKRVHYLLRDDLLKVDKFTEEILYVSKHQINTTEDVKKLRDRLIGQKEELDDLKLYISKKEKYCDDVTSLEHIRSEKEEIVNKLKGINKELKLLVRIDEQVIHMKDNLLQMKQEDKEKNIKKNDEKSKERRYTLC